jgi:hypothetical protein
VREWTLTPPSELSFWELETRWTPKFSESDCRGQNPLNWRVSYIIAKLLKCKCLKWLRMTHLDIWNKSYDQKKSWESNSQSWDFCNFRAHNFVCRPSIEFDQSEVWSKVVALIESSPHLGVSGQNAIWVMVLWPCIEYTIRVKVVASLLVRAVVSLVSPSCSWFILAPKVFQRCTNQLVVWFLCRSVRVVDDCHSF